MLAKQPIVPSKAALRRLRQLALTGTTIGAVSGIALANVDVHRRIHVAETLIENGKKLRSSERYYSGGAQAVLEADSADSDPVTLPSERTRVYRTRALDEETIHDGFGTRSDNGGAAGGQQVGVLDGLDDPAGKPAPEHVLAGENTRDGRQVSEIRNNEARTTSFSNYRSSPHADHGTAWISAGNIKSSRRPKSNGEVPAEVKRMYELIQQGDTAEAFKSFRETYSVSNGTPLTSKTKRLTTKMLQAALSSKDWEHSRKMWEHLTNLESVDDQHWNYLLRLVQERKYTEIVEVYEELFKDAVEIPPNIRMAVLRAHIATNKIEEAQKFCFAFEGKTDGLAGHLLSVIWKNKKDFSFLTNVYVGLVALDKTGALFTKTYGTMIDASIEADMDDHIEYYMREMTKDLQEASRVQHGVTIDGRICGLLMLAKARRGEWHAVEADMQAAKEANAFFDQETSFATFVQKILRYYVRDHDGQEVLTFLRRCIEEYGLVPDEILSSTVFLTLFQNGNTHLVGKWIHLLREKKLDVVLEGHHFTRVFDSLAKAYPWAHPDRLWSALLACYDRDPDTVGSDAFDVIRSSAAKKNPRRRTQLDMDTGDGAPESFSNDLEWMAWANLRQYERSKPENDQATRSHPERFLFSSDLKFKMQYALSFGRPKRALELYYEALAAGEVVCGVAISRAVEAALQTTPGNDSLAKSIIEAASNRGESSEGAKVPLMIESLKQVDDSGAKEHIVQSTLHQYDIRKREINLVTHHLTTSSARHLVNIGQAETAIKLLSAVYESEWAKIKNFEVPTMTVWLNAYATVHNVQGIQWVVQQVLSQRMWIDSKFIIDLKDARRRAMAHFDTEGEGALLGEEKAQSVGDAFDQWITDVESRIEEGKQSFKAGSAALLEIVKENRKIREKNLAQLPSSLDTISSKFDANVDQGNQFENYTNMRMLRDKTQPRQLAPNGRADMSPTQTNPRTRLYPLSSALETRGDMGQRADEAESNRYLRDIIRGVPFVRQYLKMPFRFSDHQHKMLDIARRDNFEFQCQCIWTGLWRVEVQLRNTMVSFALARRRLYSRPEYRFKYFNPEPENRQGRTIRYVQLGKEKPLPAISPDRIKSERAIAAALVTLKDLPNGAKQVIYAGHMDVKDMETLLEFIIYRIESTRKELEDASIEFGWPLRVAPEVLSHSEDISRDIKSTLTSPYTTANDEHQPSEQSAGQIDADMLESSDVPSRSDKELQSHPLEQETHTSEADVEGTTSEAEHYSQSRQYETEGTTQKFSTATTSQQVASLIPTTMANVRSQGTLKLQIRIFRRRITANSLGIVSRDIQEVRQSLGLSPLGLISDSDARRLLGDIRVLRKKLKKYQAALTAQQTPRSFRPLLTSSTTPPSPKEETQSLDAESSSHLRPTSSLPPSSSPAPSTPTNKHDPNPALDPKLSKQFSPAQMALLEELFEQARREGAAEALAKLDGAAFQDMQQRQQQLEARSTDA